MKRPLGSDVLLNEDPETKNEFQVKELPEREKHDSTSKPCNVKKSKRLVVKCVFFCAHIQTVQCSMMHDFLKCAFSSRRLLPASTMLLKEFTGPDIDTDKPKVCYFLGWRLSKLYG